MIGDFPRYKSKIKINIQFCVIEIQKSNNSKNKTAISGN